MKKEIFKTVKGYEGLYEVSDLGRLKSLKRKNVPKDRILKSCPNGDGYLCINLYKDGKRKNRTIHQLVAESFLGHVPNGMKGLIVDHDDNNESNNRLDNLFLRTQRYNSSKDKKGTSEFTGVCWYKPSSKWLAQIRINGKVKHIGYYTDELKAAKAYNSALKQLTK
mgnify:CR=1 FL=1